MTEHLIEPATIRLLSDAAEALMKAETNTGDGLCSDHCLTALLHVRKAIEAALGPRE